LTDALCAVDTASIVILRAFSEFCAISLCGHVAIMGRRKSEWLNIDYVLSWFGQNRSSAGKAYRRYLQEGIKEIIIKTFEKDGVSVEA
jgi:hypothetical protein